MTWMCPHCKESNQDKSSQCMSCKSSIVGAGTNAAVVLDDRYEILQTLKSGSMGCVYKAMDRRFNDFVAVKKMNSFIEKQYMEERFREEAKLLFILHHPGLPKVSDFFTTTDPDTGDTSFYLVMTYIKGRDLETILQGTCRLPLPLPEVMDFFVQILEILDYLHRQNPPVIYRDLSPRNIMMQEGKVFLVDFGLARLFIPRTSGTAIGTPGYASPEQYSGAAEPRSDLYSLGVLMHYLLTGIDPEGGSRQNFHFQPIRTLNAQVSEELDSLLMSLLETIPDNRPGSASEILEKVSVLNDDRKTRVLKTAFLPARSCKTGSTIKYQDIMKAVECGDIESVKEFIANGADVNAKHGGGWTILHAASENGFQDIVECLISSGADVNAVDSRGVTPLHCAAFKGFESCVELLISSDAKVNIRNSGNETPLHWAAGQGHRNVAESLVLKGSVINYPDCKGFTPLHCAVNNGQISVVEYLIKNGADIQVADTKGTTPLHTAVINGRRDLAEILLSEKTIRFAKVKGADIEARNSDGETALHLAAAYDRHETAALLLSFGASIDAVDNSGNTALHCAVNEGNRNAVELLITKGASIEKKNRKGLTPLHLAVKLEKAWLVRIFLSRGADHSPADDSSYTPLHSAAESGSYEIVKMLIDCGASSADMKPGKTPLHLAASNGHMKVAQLLLASKCKINSGDINDSTPLHLAAAKGHKEMVEFLISQGGSPFAGLLSIGTPLKHAVTGDHKDIIRLLRLRQLKLIWDILRKYGRPLLILGITFYVGYSVVHWWVNGGREIFMQTVSGIGCLVLFVAIIWAIGSNSR